MTEIRQLDPIVASRIAAGEVVERPASVLRELLDNSIDAGATKICVYIEEGGIKSLTVTDDGRGMSEDDLGIVCTSHATSKVRTLEDLFSLRTLGFRGEALSSIAACSTLTISTNGKSITIDNGKRGEIVPGSTEKGTSVRMDNLFENIPARKLFLKRAQSEATECRKTLIEKALGFENVEFLFFADGVLRLHLPAADKMTRCTNVMELDRAFLPANDIRMTSADDNASLLAICSDPSCYKRDRTQIRIFVNNRIVDSFPLVQAVTNAYSAALPGGAFPFFYLFIDDNPALVDFNIHPTKRECRLRNQSQIHSAVTAMIRRALIEKAYETDNRSPAPVQPVLPESNKPDVPERPFVSEKPRAPYTAAPKTQAAKPFDPSWFENAKAIMAKKEAPKPAQVSTTVVTTPCRYIGQVFNTFLVVEKDESIIFIDQHALHERILYDEIRSGRDVQRLIVPYKFEVERSVDEFLQENSMIYDDFGIELTRVEPMLWEMAGLPASCRKNEKDIVAFIQNQTGDMESIQKGLFAVIACHAAIKAGDPLDRLTAESLVEKCFALDRTVCPHGRDFTFRISKEELFKQVGRIV